MRVHVLHTGKVCVSPYLPYGGLKCTLLKASGLLVPKKKRLWLPVSVYFIEHPQGRVLVDCGWGRDISPDGVFDKKAQIQALGSRLLFHVNQGVVEKGCTAEEQLGERRIRPFRIPYVLLTHLDCDHAQGLRAFAAASNILVAPEELECARRHPVRYRKQWWSGIPLKTIKWNGTEGPAGKSCDLFGDGSVVLVNIPGHSDGLFAVRVTAEDGRFILLYSDGGYSSRSWREMILPGISIDKIQQYKSLKWIREQSMDPYCIESLANHDADVEPHVIGL